ncbi:MAG: pyridine nucleotide-disulfide oxidoreductase [Alphaproteobacteria bacterium]|nr:pyridine nucleotide-disulfide oxidoreductase [Alphaproteobacteria bacterium]
MDRIVIIGAGQAGAQAVASLRAEGFAGAITLVGDEPFPPYQRPPLSKAYLSGDYARERLFLKPDSFYAESQCDLRLGVAAVDLDRKAKTVTLSDGAGLPYDRLLLATGTLVRKLPVPGAELPGVHYLRGIAEVDGLRPELVAGKRLAVIGGGYIGLEVAAVARKHGLDVTVIEAAGRVMARSASEPVSAFYEAEHRGHGVKFLLGAMAQGIEGRARVTAVVTDRGSVAADAVLIGVGVVPDTSLAESAGLPCNNGIVVDEFAATADPDIFAAGDCTNHPDFTGGRVRLESVQNAIDQAKHAAASMLGKGTAYCEVPWFWSDQYDLKLQIAGLARPGDVIVPRGDPASRKFSVFHLRGGTVAAVEAVNAAPDYIIGRKLIAARAQPAPERLADISIPIKSFV